MILIQKCKSLKIHKKGKEFKLTRWSLYPTLPAWHNSPPPPSFFSLSLLPTLHVGLKTVSNEFPPQYRNRRFFNPLFNTFKVAKWSWIGCYCNESYLFINWILAERFDFSTVNTFYWISKNFVFSFFWCVVSTVRETEMK